MYDSSFEGRRAAGCKQADAVTNILDLVLRDRSVTQVAAIGVAQIVAVLSAVAAVVRHEPSCPCKLSDGPRRRGATSSRPDTWRHENAPQLGRGVITTDLCEDLHNMRRSAER